MQIYSLEEFQENFDVLMDDVQQGKTIFIEDEKEELFAVMPYKTYKEAEALSAYYTHNDAS